MDLWSVYLQEHHEQAQDELAYAVSKTPKRTHEGCLNVASANCQWREGLRHEVAFVLGQAKMHIMV